MVAALVLPPRLRQELIDRAREGAPDEVCGILAGRLSGQELAVVQRVFPIRNTADAVAAEQKIFRDRESGQPAGGRKPVHYYMDPRDQLRVYNEIDAHGLDLIGYYHSHTHSEARPSPTDVRLAIDLTSVYVLVGLEEGTTASVRAWTITKADPEAESGELQEVPITQA